MNNLEFIFDDEAVEAKIEKNSFGFKVISGDSEFLFEPTETENIYHVNINDHRMTAAMIYKNGTCYIDIDSMLFEIKEPTEDEFSGGSSIAGGEKDKIFAPMPGKIVKLLVAVGDEVTEKQPMVIVEAMKMENQVNSKAVGVVKAVNFSEGDQVDTESPIIELELSEEK